MTFIDKFKKEDGFRILCLTVLSGIVLIISFFKLIPQLPFDAAWIAILVSGVPIIIGAARGLITEFDVTADLLVAIALIAALVIGQYFAAGEVAFIMQLGTVLEDVTADKSHKSLQSLINLTPQKACLHTAAGNKEILASKVKKGNILLVRPGEAIPVDGRILKGNTSVDQSIMTGESVPVDKTAGEEVYQGTINQQGVIEIKATNAGNNSSLKKMINLVRQAEENKAPIVRIADKWARILVPIALGCSILIFFLTKNIYRAVTALVVFCPCSLVLATPTAIMAAIGNATKKGILIKSGSAVETAAKLDTLVMDKTGTLSCGKLQVKDIIMLNHDLDKTYFIKLIASAEKFSEHPLGKAIFTYSQNYGIAAEDPESFTMQAGKGILAIVDGHKLSIGMKTIDKKIMESSPDAAKLIEKIQNQGKTVLPAALDGKIAGIISIADTLRLESKSTISRLKKTGLSHIIMLTGDNEAVANSIGQSIGMTDIFASQLPGDKASTVKELTKSGHFVGMLGDGVNDAPALATASVGIVMGAIGSDVAIEAADIALMSDDIGKLPFLINLCRKTRGRIIFNIVISMCLNFFAIILAGLGILNPVTAALVHNCGSVFVVTNSALLLAYRE